MKFIANSIKTIFLILLFLEFGPKLWSSVKADYSGYFTQHTKIGTIHFNHTISYSEPYKSTLEKLFKDNSVKAIILKFNCPEGGTLGSCQELFATISSLKKEYPKPIISFVENFCFANSYYVACATDYIISTPGTLIGNINNTPNSLFNIYDQTDPDNNVNTDTTKQLAYQKISLQNATLNGYQQLLQEIACTRNISLEQKSLWADGTIFTGEQAFDLHLIDQIGPFNTVLILLKKLIPLEETLIWVNDEDTGFITTLMQQFAHQEDQDKPVLFE